MIENKTVKGVLEKLNETKLSYIYGGYLRDLKFNSFPNDVDIVTTASLEEIQKTFPSFSGTEKGLLFGVGRFTKDGITFEIKSQKNLCIKTFLSKKDFTINALAFNNEELITHENSIIDIENKILRSTGDFKKHLIEFPQAYIRGIRFLSKYGLAIHPSLLEFYSDYKFTLDQISDSRKSTEGYAILKGTHILHAVSLMQKTGLLKEGKYYEIKPLDSNSNSPTIQLLNLSNLIGLDSAEHFVELFGMKKEFIEILRAFDPLLNGERKPNNSKELNTLLHIKRIEYEGNKALLKKFHSSLN